MIRKSPARFILVASIAAASSGYAATATKSATGTDLSSTAATTWSGGSGINGSPTNVDIATWTSTSLGGNLTVSSAVDWSAINVSGATANISITGSQITNGNIVLTGNRTLAIANNIVLAATSTYNISDVNGTTATDATLSGIISGGSGVIKSGNGTLVLSNSNIYGGGTTINAGVLQASNSATALGSSTVTVNSPGTLWVAVGNNLTVANNISGAGLFQVTPGGTGGGATTLSGNLSGFTGTMEVLPNGGGGGKVAFSNGTQTAVPSSTATIKLLSGGTLYLSSTVNYGNSFQLFGGSTGEALGQLRIENGNITGNVTLMANSTIGGTSGPTGTISGVISDSGGNFGFTKQGASTLVLTNTNTYTGGTTLSSGIVTFNNGSLGSSGAITMDSGSLRWGTGNTQDISSRFTLVAAKTAVLDTNGNNVTFASAFGNSTTASLTKNGTGILTLSGANTYTGTTTINSGTLALSGGNNRLATAGTVSFSAASTLDLGSTQQSLVNLTVGNTIAGTVTGTAGGKLTLTGSSFALGGGANQTNTLNLSGLPTFVYGNATGTFRVSGVTNSSANGGAGTLTLASSGNITAASFGLGDFGSSLNTSVNQGTVNLGAAATINANTITIGGNRGAGTVQYLSAANPTLTLRASDGTGRVTSMILSDHGGPNTTGTVQGLVNLTSNVTGTSTLDAMITTLTIGKNTRATGAGGNTIVNTGNFTMGAGTLDATTIILGQILAGFDNGGASSTSGILSVNGGAVKVNDFYFADQQASPATGSATLNANFNLNSGANLYAANIAPGTGTGNATANRTFTWNDGTIHNYNAATDLTIASGLTTFNLSGTGTTHAFNIDASRTGTVNQVMSGNGTLTKIGSGSLALSGANTYSGATVISEGTLSAGNVVVSSNNSNLGNATSAVTLGAGSTQGTLSYTGGNATFTRGLAIGGAGGGRLDVTTAGQALTLATGNITGSGLFTVGGAGNTIISSRVTQTGGLTKEGAGTLSLNGNNTFTGGTTINDGTLAVGHANALGSGGLAVNGGTLDLNTFSSSVGTITSTSGTIASTGGNGILTGLGLTKTGSGTTTLNSGVTYSGGSTLISGGVLAVKGAIASTGTTTVGSTGTLSGSGRVFNPVTVQSGGTTRPSLAGATSSSVLTLDLTYNSGSTASSGIFSGTTTSNSTAGYDQVVVTTTDLQLGTGNTTSQLLAGGNGSAVSGVTLNLSMTTATFNSLKANATNSYQGLGSNSSLNNYFVFSLDPGLSSIGRFQTLSLDINGSLFNSTIQYGGTGFGRFGSGLGVTNTLGDVFVNGQEFAISYIGNFSTNSTIGGNDIVLTAIPEPGAMASLLGGLGVLVAMQRRRRRF